MKMSEGCDQNFDTFFGRISETFRLHFDVRGYVHKKCENVQALVAFCVCALSQTHTDTHTHTHTDTAMRVQVHVSHH